MNRYKRRDRLRRVGIPNQRDTPVKSALRTQLKKSKLLLPGKRYDTLQEEPEVDDTSDHAVKPTTLVGSSVPAHCKTGKSVSCFSDPAFTGNSRNGSTSALIPVNKESHSQNVLQAGHPDQVTPILDTFKGEDTPGGVALCSREPNITFNSEEDDDNCYSSASTTLSSFPSPEIFRKENTVEMVTFPSKEELLDSYLHIKNSTLLDVSHAENIHIHHQPNLSTIICDHASTILTEKKCESSHHKNPEPESKIQKDSDKSLRKKTSPEPTERRLILFRKKVWFKSPITTEILEAKNNPSSIHTTTQPSRPPEQMKTNAKTYIRDDFVSREEALPLRVTLKKPAKISSKKAKFFDFVSDNERDVFFQMMRERCAKLRSNFIFPITLETQNPSVL